MRDETDPEVLADLRLRDTSMRDCTRTGEAHWTPPKIHSKVPCRGRCGSVVDWAEDAEERFQIFCRELAKRNQAQLDRTQIVFCDNCRAIGNLAAAQRNRKLVDAVAVAIRELKDGCEPHREHELIDKLTRAGHPDIAGLVQWLKDKKNSAKRVTRGAL